jgi:sugar lactone lactonase YvrE
MQTGLIQTIAGNGEKGVPADGARATESPLVDPRAVAVDSQNNVYVLERGGHALRVVRSDGTIRTVAGTGERGDATGPALQSQFGSPKHLAVDGSDNVYIADDQNARIVKYDPQAKTVTTVLGAGAEEPNRDLSHPHGVCVHEDGSLYIVDTGHDRIIRLVDR